MAADHVDAIVPALEAFDLDDEDADAGVHGGVQTPDLTDDEDEFDDTKFDSDDPLGYFDNSDGLNQYADASEAATIPADLDVQFVPSAPNYGIKIVSTFAFGAVFRNCTFSGLTTFEYCWFSNVVFEDVHFHNCKFSNTVFQNMSIIGDYWNRIRYINYKFPEDSEILKAPEPGSTQYLDVPPNEIDLQDPGRFHKTSELWVTESAPQPQDISDRAWDEFDEPANTSEYMVDGYYIHAGLELIETRLISKFELSDANSHNFFRGALFKGCTLDNVSFEDCTLFGCVFENCHLKNVTFHRVALIQTAFRGCNLTGLLWENKRYGATECQDETFASDDREPCEPKEILDRSHLLSARQLRPALTNSMEQNDGDEL